MAVVVVVVICILIMALFFAVTIAGGRAHDRQNLEAEKQRLADERATAKVVPTAVANDDLWPSSGDNPRPPMRRNG